MDVSDGMIFNDQELPNDLEGNGDSTATLEGSVMFGQTQIIPSKPPTDASDIRPHLVSLRDTLVLFKPLSSNFDISAGVKLTVYDKNDNKVYGETNMLTPDKLPKIAESSDGDIYDFLDVHVYDYTIPTQDELDLIDDGTEGTYLEGILNMHTSIKIELTKENWIENVLLPEMPDSEEHNRLVFFVSNAEKSTFIRFNGNTVELVGGSKLAFTNIKGNWNNILSSYPTEQKVIKNFIVDKHYGKIIESSNEITKMGVDTKGARIDKLLKKSKNIKIVTANGQWTKNFYLPKDKQMHDGKSVTFTSSAGYNSYVKYDLGSRILSQGNSLTFMNKNGKWVELDDTIYSSIKYGNNFWSLLLPFEVVKPGISIAFYNNENVGTLKNFQVGAPNELLIHTIDLGLLVDTRDEFKFQKNPKYHAEYFQQIPVSRLIVNEYEPMVFNEVVIPNGITYTNASSDEGGVYSGDMRGYIVKLLVSMGINHANYGIHSGIANKERTPYTCGQVTATNSRGRYSNGVKIHGLSGGNSMITL